MYPRREEMKTKFLALFFLTAVTVSALGLFIGVGRNGNAENDAREPAPAAADDVSTRREEDIVVMAENWCWIELIGFDKDSPDYAVGEFLQRFGRPLEGVVLLFADIGFAFAHRGMKCEFTFRPCDCAYGDKDRSEERLRQEWTNYDLRGLIRTLQKKGVKVYFSFFNFCYEQNIGGIDLAAYFDRTAGWELTYAVNVIKKLNGVPFSQLLFPKVKRVVEDYGFDGIMFADGISSARPAIENGDFSDAMAEMFAEFGGQALPPRCDGDARAFAARREYILAHCRAEWTEFLMTCWEKYYAELHEYFDGCGELLFNSCWTRDPFEAAYRYGIDYRRCFTKKSDRIMVEEVSATRRILGDEDQGGFYLPLSARDYFCYEFYLMQMSLRCCLPDTEQITLTPVKDTTEQWDIIRHAPTELQRAILRRNNCFVFENGTYKHCSAGPLYCLSDAIPAESWNWIAGVEKFRLEDIDGAEGFTLTWSDACMDADLAGYIAKREYSAGEIYKEFLTRGLTVSAMARADSLRGIRTPVFAANSALYSEKEIAALRNCGVPVVLAGRCCDMGRKPVWECEAEGFRIAVYGAALPSGFKKAAAGAADVKFEEADLSPGDEQGGIWTMPLRYRRLPEAFFRRMSELLNGAFGLPYADEPQKRCKVTAFRKAGKTYMLLSNDEYFYIVPKVKAAGKIAAARSLLKMDGYRVRTDGNCFYDRVPPRGMDVAELETEN